MTCEYSDAELWISMDCVDGLDAARLLASRYPDGMPADQVLRIVTAVAVRSTTPTHRASCTATAQFQVGNCGALCGNRVVVVVGQFGKPLRSVRLSVT
jgi:hypothetical protein